MLSFHGCLRKSMKVTKKPMMNNQEMKCSAYYQRSLRVASPQSRR